MGSVAALADSHTKPQLTISSFRTLNLLTTYNKKSKTAVGKTEQFLNISAKEFGAGAVSLVGGFRSQCCAIP